MLVESIKTMRSQILYCSYAYDTENTDRTVCTVQYMCRMAEAEERRRAEGEVRVNRRDAGESRGTRVE